MAQRRYFVGWMCLAVFAAPGGTLAAPPTDVVRNDWYFRESLGAIRDWDAIVGRVYPQQEKAPRPAFPVPTDGKASVWPNPIPRRLWPTANLPPRTTVRVDGGAMQIERIGPDGKPASLAVPAAEATLSCAHPGGGGKEWIYAAIPTNARSKPC